MPGDKNSRGNRLGATATDGLVTASLAAGPAAVASQSVVRAVDVYTVTVQPTLAGGAARCAAAERNCSSSAETAMAISAGVLPPMPEMPIGQVSCRNSDDCMPCARISCSKRRRFEREPISPQ